jgi:hypothetical protein
MPKKALPLAWSGSMCSPTATVTFLMVLGEQALYTNVGGAAVMTGQLEHLQAVLKLPRLRLGIVPQGAPYRVPLNNGF